jgi:hypothetical protein
MKPSSQAGDFLDMRRHPEIASLADCKSVG